MHIFSRDMHFLLKPKLLLLALLPFVFSCVDKTEKKSIFKSVNHAFETKTINQNFRDSLGASSFIKLSDGYTYFELAGLDTAEIIVLVHGFSVPSYIWDSTYTAALKKGYRVLRYDAFGRGKSDRPTISYDINLSYRQLSGLIDSLDITAPINLVGLSWGGRVVSYFAAKHPEKVRKLILVDPSGFEPVVEKDSIPVKIDDKTVAKILKEKAADMADSQLEDFYHPERYTYWPSLYKPQMEYKGFVHALLSTQANKKDISSFMKQLYENETPVKLIMGKEDQVVIPSETIPLAKAQIPTIDITLIENAGHLPHIEESQVFNSVFFQFLEN